VLLSVADLFPTEKDYYIFSTDCDVLNENDSLYIEIGSCGSVTIELNKTNIGSNSVYDFCQVPELLSKDTEDCYGGFYYDCYAVSVFIEKLGG
jgi:hypothetical protein